LAKRPDLGAFSFGRLARLVRSQVPKCEGPGAPGKVAGEVA
jgi:hypothetical protein